MTEDPKHCEFTDVFWGLAGWPIKAPRTSSGIPGSRGGAVEGEALTIFLGNAS